jgi:regulator of sigma E protease
VRVRRAGNELDIAVTPQTINKKDMLGNDIKDTGIGIGPVVPGELADVQVGSPAAAAGLKARDIIVSVAKSPVGSFADIADALRDAGGKPVKIIYSREERDEKLKRSRWKRHDTEITPNPVTESAGADAAALQAAGITSPVPGGPRPEILVRLNVFEAFARGANTIRYIVVKTLDFIGQLLTGTGDYQQLSGPIGIASVSGQVLVFFGVVALINLAAVLSVSIGLLNLFPIPMLDGGHLLYYGIEAIRGRPLGERAQELGFRIGLAFVVGLMLFATWNDLTKFRLF